jgi:flagellar biosynthesis protein FlhG
MDQAVGLRNIVGHKKVTQIGSLNRGPLDKKPPVRNKIRVISVTSGKGGVGKTSVVANLALALQNKGKKVLILDADLGLANMDVMLGLNPRYTISHVLQGEKRIEEVIVTAPGGFKLLPAASGIQELTELDNSQRLILLNELDTLQDQFDILLIDTGAGISANVMYFNFAAMEKVIIVTNEPTSLTDAYAMIKVLSHKYQQKKFMVLINSARTAQEAEKIYRHLRQVVDQFLGSPSLDYLGWIPYDRYVPLAIRQQQMVLERYPHTPASRHFIEVADRLLSSEGESVFEGDIKFFWRRLLNY